MARKNTKKRMQHQQQPVQPRALPPQQQQQPLSTPPAKQQQEQQQQAGEPDLFGDEFFSRAPTPPPAVDLQWDDAEDVPRIAPDKRRAMLATMLIFGVFATLVGGFIIYTQVIMPTPVALGASSGTFTIPEAPQMPAVGARRAGPLHPPETIEQPPTPIEHPILSPEPIIANVRARRAVPLPPPTPKADRVADDSLAAQAMRMLNSGHASDARRLAQQATQASPDRADGWIVLGAAYASLGDQEAAKTAYANCTARASGARVATCRALAR